MRIDNSKMRWPHLGAMDWPNESDGLFSNDGGPDYRTTPQRPLHQLPLRAASMPKSVGETASAGLGIDQQRSQEESDRYVVRLPLNVSGLGQIVRFLPNKVELFDLYAAGFLAEEPGTRESSIRHENRKHDQFQAVSQSTGR
jgi:hypothetical protein